VLQPRRRARDLCGQEAHDVRATGAVRDQSGEEAYVRTIKERWRVERMYEDLKGELGLDHFEDRSFPGTSVSVNRPDVSLSVARIGLMTVLAQVSQHTPREIGGSTTSAPFGPPGMKTWTL
jgi:hypothetical protein